MRGLNVDKPKSKWEMGCLRDEWATAFLLWKSAKTKNKMYTDAQLNGWSRIAKATKNRSLIIWYEGAFDEYLSGPQCTRSIDDSMDHYTALRSIHIKETYISLHIIF